MKNKPDGLWLWLEFAALYAALPLVLWRVAVSGAARVWVMPWLWLAALLATAWLARGRGWTRKKFFSLDGVARGDWLRMGLRALAGAALLAVALRILRPDALFKFPLEKTGFWAAVMLLYPVLSVVPQGMVYRALFFERYAPLFGRFACAASAVVFGLGHIVFNNPHAVVLTLVGGAVFAWQHRRTGSLVFVNAEHALLGNLAFTIGWGVFLHAGTLASRGGG